MNEEQYINIFKALADETRLQVVHLLSSQQRCACQILDTFKITQSTLSHHMNKLVSSGLVDAEKQGKWVYYKLNTEVLSEFKGYIGNIGASDLTCEGCKS